MPPPLPFLSAHSVLRTFSHSTCHSTAKSTTVLPCPVPTIPLAFLYLTYYHHTQILPVVHLLRYFFPIYLPPSFPPIISFEPSFSPPPSLSSLTFCCLHLPLSLPPWLPFPTTKHGKTHFIFRPCLVQSLSHMTHVHIFTCVFTTTVTLPFPPP